MLIRLALSPLTKMTPSKSGHLRTTSTSHTSNTTIPKGDMTSIKIFKKCEKWLHSVTCLEHPLSKYHPLRALALRVVKTTLHLGLFFLNHTCFTLDGELDEVFFSHRLRIVVVIVFFFFLVYKFWFFRKLNSPISLFNWDSYLSENPLAMTSTLSVSKLLTISAYERSARWGYMVRSVLLTLNKNCLH